VTIVADKPEETVAALRAGRGKDIWLFGGGSLFRSLAKAGLVDTVEVSVVPVLLGGGIPLLPSPANQIKLSLTGHKVYKNTRCLFGVRDRAHESMMMFAGANYFGLSWKSTLRSLFS
jgi:dihydrofolate reductase